MEICSINLMMRQTGSRISLALPLTEQLSVTVLLDSSTLFISLRVQSPLTHYSPILPQQHAPALQQVKPASLVMTIAFSSTQRSTRKMIIALHAK
jgi:hypothetical protein